MVVKLEFTLTGPDAEIVEPLARAICRYQGGNCTDSPKCKSEAACRVDGWSSYTDEVEVALATLRRTHTIVPKAKKAKA